MKRTTRRRPQRGQGFTLLELLIVMVVIGIIIVFILVAARDGIRRSEERATQALIAKIEAGLIDRLDALVSTRADYNAAHSYMAAIWPQNFSLQISSGPYAKQFIHFIPDQPDSVVPSGIPRAAVIAQFDRIKAEMPDVFALQGDANYPFNFAATPYLGGSGGIPVLGNGYDTYLLPIGVSITNNPFSNSFGGNPTPLPVNPNTTPVSNLPVFPNSTGIFGASYGAIGGLTKQLAGQLGGSPNWYDGVDNNGNGLIDEVGESGLTLTAGSPLANQLANHTHKTARSEALYAILVSGTGPLGSVFSPDDFSDREVKDTDGDGLLEFVDAWGEPLQFYRWPVLYYGPDGNNPDVQRGWIGYPTIPGTAPPISVVPREQNTLDPNQQLMAPAWWSGSTAVGYNLGGPWPATPPLSGPANVVQQFFIPLLDPFTNSTVGATAPNGTFWDRGTNYFQRRAYFSRPLILSSGPDRVAGVPRVDNAYFQSLSSYSSQRFLNGSAVGASGLTGTSPGYLYQGSPNLDSPWLFLESSAAQYTINRTTDIYQTPLTDPTNAAITNSLSDVGADDITNQNLSGPGGAIQ